MPHAALHHRSNPFQYPLLILRLRRLQGRRQSTRRKDPLPSRPVRNDNHRIVSRSRASPIDRAREAATHMSSTKSPSLQGRPRIQRLTGSWSVSSYPRGTVAIGYLEDIVNKCQRQCEPERPHGKATNFAGDPSQTGAPRRSASVKKTASSSYLLKNPSSPSPATFSTKGSRVRIRIYSS